MNKRRLLIIGIIVLLLLVGMIAYLTTRSAPSTGGSNASPTATPDPYQKDRELLKTLSGNFAAKFFTNTRPDSPEYLASIKPYMTAGFYGENQRLTQQDKSALQYAKPITSQTDKVEVKDIGKDKAATEVAIKSTQTGITPYTQVVLLQWIKEGSLWHVNAVGIESTTKE